MTFSLLNDCLLLKDHPLKKMEDYFATINVDVFASIFSKCKEHEVKNIILFILCAFDEESPMVIPRQDSVEEKKQICEYLDIPEYARQDLCYLKDREVRKAATSYMIQFAGEEFRNLMFMKIQLADFELSITNRDYTIKETKTSKGETEGSEVSVTTEVYDTKEHGKAIAEKERLAKAIVKVEREMMSKVKLLGIEAMKEWKKSEGKKIKTRRGGGIENHIS